MADPFTMAAVGMGVSAAAGGVGAFGSVFKGAAGSASATYQAGVAMRNKEIAEQNANFAYMKGEAQAQQLGMQSRFHIGQAKATQAAGNINVNMGSAVDARRSMAEMGSLDQARARNNAAREMYGHQIEATGYEAQAGLLKSQAGWEKTAGYIGAASSILGGASSVADKWSKYSKLTSSSGPAVGGDLASNYPVYSSGGRGDQPYWTGDEG